MSRYCVASLCVVCILIGNVLGGNMNAFDDDFDDSFLGLQWEFFNGTGVTANEAVNPGYVTIDIPVQSYSRMSMIAPDLATWPEYVLLAKVDGEVGDVAAGPGTGTKPGGEGFFFNSYSGNQTIARLKNDGANAVYSNGDMGFFTYGGPEAWYEPMYWRFTLRQDGANYMLDMEFSGNPGTLGWTLLGSGDATSIVTDASGYRWDLFTDSRDFTIGSDTVVPLTTLYDYVDFTLYGYKIVDDLVAVSEGLEVDENTPAVGASHDIVLQQPPTSPVTINLSWDSSQISVSSSSVVFNSGDYDIPKTVTVYAVDDMALEGAHSSDITHSVSTSDVDYAAIANFNTSISILDNDYPEVVITEIDDMQVSETDPNSDDYEVVLAGIPSGTVQIDLSYDNTEITAVPSVLTFGVGTWNVPQTVEVTSVDDASSEAPEVIPISHTVSGGGYDGVSIDDVNVTVISDEAYCGQPGTVYLDSDLTGPDGNRDCVVDLYDFAVMAGQWLGCTDPFDPVGCP